MKKKIREFLVKLPKILKKLTLILHSSEVESVFKKLKNYLNNSDTDPIEVLELMTSFCLFLSSLGLIVVIVFICIIVGGF